MLLIQKREIPGYLTGLLKYNKKEVLMQSLVVCYFPPKNYIVPFLRKKNMGQNIHAWGKKLYGAKHLWGKYKK